MIAAKFEFAVYKYGNIQMILREYTSVMFIEHPVYVCLSAHTTQDLFGGQNVRHIY